VGDVNGDGIPDLVDQCWTSPDLIKAGKTVQANGCVFQHQATIQPRTSTIMPGTVSVGK